MAEGYTALRQLERSMFAELPGHANFDALLDQMLDDVVDPGIGNNQANLNCSRCRGLKVMASLPGAQRKSLLAAEYSLPSGPSHDEADFSDWRCRENNSKQLALQGLET